MSNVSACFNGWSWRTVQEVFTLYFQEQQGDFEVQSCKSGIDYAGLTIKKINEYIGKSNKAYLSCLTR